MARIYLSPSTQENNIGVGIYGTEEKRMNELCDYLVKYLESYGHIVKRNNPKMTLQQIKEDSDLFKADIHIALHSNASTGKARGCEVFCYKFGTDSNKLASYIYMCLESLTPSDDRGIKEGHNMYGVGKHLFETEFTKATAVLIETAFHDNHEDAEWIITHMPTIAVAIGTGINQFLGVWKKVEVIDYKVLYENLLWDINTLIDKYEGGAKQ